MNQLAASLSKTGIKQPGAKEIFKGTVRKAIKKAHIDDRLVIAANRLFYTVSVHCIQETDLKIREAGLRKMLEQTASDGMLQTDGILAIGDICGTWKIIIRSNSDLRPQHFLFHLQRKEADRWTLDPQTHVISSQDSSISAAELANILAWALPDEKAIKTKAFQ